MWFDDADVVGDGGPVAVVNGATIPLTVGDGFIETAIGLANQAGYSKFRVFLGSNEIVDQEDAPETIRENMKIRIFAYDTPASS